MQFFHFSFKNDDTFALQFAIYILQQIFKIVLSEKKGVMQKVSEMNLDDFKNLILACCTSSDDSIRQEKEAQYNALIEEDCVSVIRLHLQNIIVLPSQAIQKSSAILLRRLLSTVSSSNIEIFTPEIVEELKNTLFTVFSNENYDRTIRIFVGGSLLLVNLAANANEIENDFFSPLFELCNSEIPTIASVAVLVLAQFVDNKLIDLGELAEPINTLISTRLSIEQTSEVFLAVFRLVYSVSSVIDVTPYISTICAAISSFQEADLNALLRDLLSYKTISKSVFENGADELIPVITEIIKNTEKNISTRGLAIQILVSIIEVNPEKFIEQTEEITSLLIDCLGEIDESYDPTVNPYVDSSIHSQAAVAFINLSSVFRGYYSFFENVIERFNAMIAEESLESAITAFNFMSCIASEASSYHGLYFPNDHMQTFIEAISSDNEILSYVALRCFDRYLEAFSVLWRPTYELATEGVIEALIEISQQKESQPFHELAISAISRFIQLFPKTIPVSAEALIEYLFSMIDQENIDIMCTIFNALKIIAQILGQSYMPYAEQTLEVVNEIIGGGLDAYEQDVFFAATKLFVSLLNVIERDKAADHANEYLSLIEQIDIHSLSMNAKASIHESLIIIMRIVPAVIAEHFDFFFQKSMEVFDAEYEVETFDFSANSADLFDYEIKTCVQDQCIVGYKKDDIAQLTTAFDIINILMATCKDQFFEHNVELLVKIIELQRKVSSDRIKKYVVNFMFQLYQSFDPSYTGKLEDAMKLSDDDKGQIVTIVLLCVQQCSIAYSTMENVADILQVTPLFARTIHFLVNSGFITTIENDFLFLLLMSIFKQMIDSEEREKTIFNRNAASFRVEFDIGFESSIQEQLMHCFRDLFKRYPEFVAHTCTTECPMLKGRDRTIIFDYFPLVISTNQTKAHVNKTVFDMHGCFIAYAGCADMLEPLAGFMREALDLNLFDISHGIIACISHIIVHFEDPEIVGNFLDIFLKAMNVVKKSKLWEQTVYYSSKIIMNYSSLINVEEFSHMFIEPLQYFQNVNGLTAKKRAIVLEAIPFVEAAESLTPEERATLTSLARALQESI